MNTFLHEVAQRLIEENPNGLDNVAVVFNHRRPFHFLRRYLKELYNDKPFFMPQTMRMDDLVGQISGLTITPNEFLLFDLYDVYASVYHDKKTADPQKYKEEIIDFASFVPTGDMMLSDFSQIDLYDVNAKDMFSLLKDIKELEIWNPRDGAKKGPIQSNFIVFFQLLGEFYNVFKERLSTDKKAYSGMAYRQAAQIIANPDIQALLPFEKIYFVGFNALSTCEKRIIETLIRNKKATLIVDGDDYYVGDTMQEAGRFMREMKHDNTPSGSLIANQLPDQYGNHFNQSEKKKIAVVQCAENVIQCKYATQWLIDIGQRTNYNYDETAVVLADEHLLVPMLNSLPEVVKEVNVTMGFPYSYTSVHTLVTNLFNLLLNAKTIKDENNAETLCFRHTQISTLLSDKFISRLTGLYYSFNYYERIFSENGYVYASWDKIKEAIKQKEGENCNSEGLDRIAPIFNNINVKDFLDLWEMLFNMLYAGGDDGQKVSNVSKDTERAALVAWDDIRAHLQEIYSRHSDKLKDIKTLRLFYNRMASRHNVALIGEPLKGLQILGMLEARSLDFKNIILLSANESILPSGNKTNTLIPYDVKVNYGMPTYKEHDAVYAHHFYSLMQRADDITLLYNTDKNGSGKGEMSRYVMQIRDEMRNSDRANIDYSEALVQVEHSNQEKCNDDKQKAWPMRTIEKTPEIIETLLRKANPDPNLDINDPDNHYGFSPTAMNTYHECGMKYYYQYVMGVRETDEFEEETNASQLGTIIHAFFENAYKEYLEEGKPLDAQFYERWDNDLTIEQYVTEAINKLFGQHAADSGRNHLASLQAQGMIKRFMDYEKKEVTENNKKIVIKGAERKLAHKVNIHIDAEQQDYTVYVAGTIDRIDEVDGTIRIADYKSGRVKDDDLKYSISNRTSEIPSVKPKTLQVMTYLYLYLTEINDVDNITAGLLPLQKSKPEYMELNYMEHIPTLEDCKKEVIYGTIQKIMDKTQPFEATPKAGNCTFCPMTKICLAVGVRAGDDNEQV